MQAVDQLLGAAKAFVAPQATGNEIPLPWGLALTVAETGNEPTLTLGWPTPAAAGDATVSGAMHLRLGAGYAVIPSGNAGVQIAGLTGLDQVALRLGYDGGPTGAVRLRRGAGQSNITVALLPHCPGLGALAALVLNAAVDALLPLALDALADHSVLGPPLRGVGDALGLRSGGQFLAAAARPQRQPACRTGDPAWPQPLGRTRCRCCVSRDRAACGCAHPRRSRQRRQHTSSRCSFLRQYASPSTSRRLIHSPCLWSSPTPARFPN